MEFEMIYKQKRNLIIAHVIGVLLGLVVGVTSGYESFVEVLGAVTLIPILLAVLLRFIVRTYQITKIKFGTKVYDQAGNYIVVERPGRGFVAAIAIPFLVVGIITTLPQISQLLFYIILAVLVVIGAFFCYKDIKFFVDLKKNKNQQD